MNEENCLFSFRANVKRKQIAFINDCFDMERHMLQQNSKQHFAACFACLISSPCPARCLHQQIGSWNQSHQTASQGQTNIIHYKGKINARNKTINARIFQLCQSYRVITQTFPGIPLVCSQKPVRFFTVYSYEQKNLIQNYKCCNRDRKSKLIHLHYHMENAKSIPFYSQKSLTGLRYMFLKYFNL